MLRITNITTKRSPILKLEGKLSGPWVDELQKCWKAIAAGTHRDAIMIDMRGVSFMDHRGQALLLRMEREGASLTECSVFIRELLRGKDAPQKKARQISKKKNKENEHASTVRT